jgi:hypothetical protein
VLIRRGKGGPRIPKNADQQNKNQNRKKNKMPTYKASEPKKAEIYFVEPDIYEVEIKTAVEKISKSGNPMIKLTCTILLPDGSNGPEVWEHLTFTDKAAWKIDQVLTAVGIAYIAGQDIDVEANDLIGKRGVCLVGEEAGAENPDHRFNKLERWLFGDEKKEWLSGKKTSAAIKSLKPVAPKKQAEVFTDADGDEIPF